MAFDPNSPVQVVRLLYGDRAIPFILEDSVVLWALAQSGANPYSAAILCARAAAAQASSLVDKSVGDLSISWSQRATAFLALIPILQVQASHNRRIRPFGGGISQAGKIAQEADTDAIQPEFTSGQFTNTSYS